MQNLQDWNLLIGYSLGVLFCVFIRLQGKQEQKENDEAEQKFWLRMSDLLKK